MNFVKKFSYLVASLSVIFLSTSVNAATITYNWFGADGTGAITFFDTNITDAENFTVAFDTGNVANISYTFNNGTSIEDADNFSGSSTLQAFTELGDAMFTATGGIIEGWTFKQMLQAIKADPVLINTIESTDNSVLMARIGQPAKETGRQA